MADRTETLLKRLPSIRRTRGFRLYTSLGTRVLSLWSDYGRALLGFRPEGIPRMAKGMIDRGLLSDIPTQYQKRLTEMVRTFVPSARSVRIMSSSYKAISLARAFAGLPESNAVPHLACCRFLYDEYLARPPLPTVTSLVLPMPAAFSLGILISDREDGLDAVQEDWVDGLRAAVNMMILSKLSSPIQREKQMRLQTSAWARFDTLVGNELFTRRGPWLFPTYPRDMHEEIFLACLSKRIVISPDYEFPSSVPLDFDDGEIAPLRDISRLKESLPRAEA
ncbi:MAG: hypothetical protein N3A02_06020 [Rectinema sp.]|nr:hypothetical protein [Rectinema sp.]